MATEWDLRLVNNGLCVRGAVTGALSLEFKEKIPKTDRKKKYHGQLRGLRQSG